MAAPPAYSTLARHRALPRRPAYFGNTAHQLFRQHSIGDAFDVTANKKQTAFYKAKHYKPDHAAYASSYEIELKNAKAEPVTVTVQEPVPGEWEILKESHPHKKMASGTAEWQVTIPAESSKKLTYTVKVQY